MSSPPALFLRFDRWGGRRVMVEPCLGCRPPSLLSQHVGRAAFGWRLEPSHCAADISARSVVTGSYGLIVLLPSEVDKNHDLAWTSPPSGRIACI
jgi:hypothetical protein